MSDKERIRSLLKEAELYQKQSLLAQSKEKYLEALEVIEKSEQLGNRTRLIGAVKNKMRGVEEKQAEIDQAPAAPELTEAQQHLIMKRFSFSKDKETAVFEGALALAKFGQYEQALAEFHKLLKKGIMPLVAARNIISCHLTFSSPEAAIAQFTQWVSRESLSKQQLNQLRTFIKSLLEKKGFKAELPGLDKAAPETGKDEEEEDDAIDISSVSFQMDSGPLKGETVGLDVTFQSGNSISVIITPDRKDLLDSLKIGSRLPDVQCYSPIGFFKSSGIVFGKTEIKDGPRRGDYMLDISIEAG